VLSGVVFGVWRSGVIGKGKRNFEDEFSQQEQKQKPEQKQESTRS